MAIEVGILGLAALVAAAAWDIGRREVARKSRADDRAAEDVRRYESRTEQAGALRARLSALEAEFERYRSAVSQDFADRDRALNVFAKNSGEIPKLANELGDVSARVDTLVKNADALRARLGALEDRVGTVEKKSGESPDLTALVARLERQDKVIENSLQEFRRLIAPVRRSILNAAAQDIQPPRQMSDEERNVSNG